MKIKYLAWGALAGTIVGIASNGVLVFLGVAVFALAVVSMMDWSGQGDGREGCDRHSSCNH